MERRKVLAAISAAIATPAAAWRPELDAARLAAGEDPDRPLSSKIYAEPEMGLTPEQIEVREYLKKELLQNLDNLLDRPGPAPLADLWFLSEALIHYANQPGHAGSILNSMHSLLLNEDRFVVVNCDDLEAVADFAEGLKGSDDMVVRCPRRLAECVQAVVAAMHDHEEKDLHLLLGDDSEEPGEGDVETIEVWNIPARGTPAALTLEV